MPLVPEDNKERPEMIRKPAAPAGVRVGEKSRMDQAGKLRHSIKEAQNIDPGLSERVHKMQTKTGLPIDFLQRNIEDIEKASAERDFDPHKYYAESPVVAKWLADNPVHAAAARDNDDIKNLSYLEKQWRHIRQSRKRGERMVRASELGWKNLREGLTQYEQRELAEINDLARGATDYGITGWFEGVPGVLSEQSAIFQKIIGGGLEKAAVGAVGGGAVGTVALPGAGTAAGATAGAVLGWRLGAAWEAGQLEAGLAYNGYVQIKDEDGNPLDPTVVKGSALAVGAVNAALETVGLMSVTRTIPGLGWLTRGGMRRILVNPTTRKAFAEYAKAIGLGIGGEGVTEGMQEFVKVVGQELLQLHGEGRLEKASPQEIWGRIFSKENTDAIIHSARAGTQAGGGMSAVGAAYPLGADIHKARRAEMTKQAFEDLGKGVENLKMKEKLPGRTREVLERLGEDNGDPMAGDGPAPEFEAAEAPNTVYIPAKAWDQYFQSKGINPEDAARELLGDNLDEYTNAVESDSDMAVPLADYADKIAGSEHNTFFQDEVKLNPDDMNYREKQELAEKLDEAEKAGEAEIETEAPQLDEQGQSEVKEVLDQRYKELIEAGTDPDTAATQAELFSKVIETFARTEGMSPKEVAALRPLKVQQRTEGVPGAADEAAQVNQEVFHGSESDDLTEIKKGFFSDNPEFVKRFLKPQLQPDSPMKGTIYKADIDFKNPFVIDNDGKHWDDDSLADIPIYEGKSLNELTKSNEDIRYATAKSEWENDARIVAVFKHLKEKGLVDYDGVIFKNMTEADVQSNFYVPLEPVPVRDSGMPKVDPMTLEEAVEAGIIDEDDVFLQEDSDIHPELKNPDGTLRTFYRGQRNDMIPGKGSFFTSNPDAAETYTKTSDADKRISHAKSANIGAFYITMKNPFVVDAKGASFASIPIDVLSGVMTPEEIDNKYYISDFTPELAFVSTDIVVQIITDKGKDYDGVIFKNIHDYDEIYDPPPGTPPATVVVPLRDGQTKSIFKRDESPEEAVEAGIVDEDDVFLQEDSVIHPELKNPDGTLKTFYRGRGRSLERMGGEGLFFSDSPDVANSYVSDEDGAIPLEDMRGTNVIPVTLQMENPFIVDMNEGIDSGINSEHIKDVKVWDSMTEYSTEPRDFSTVDVVEAVMNVGGYDGVVFKNIFDVADVETLEGDGISTVVVPFNMEDIRPVYSDEKISHYRDGLLLQEDADPTPKINSKLARVMDGIDIPKRMKAKDLMAKVSKDVKKEELKWSGLEDMLADKLEKDEFVTAEEFAEMKENLEFPLEEVESGANELGTAHPWRIYNYQGQVSFDNDVESFPSSEDAKRYLKEAIASMSDSKLASEFLSFNPDFLGMDYDESLSEVVERVERDRDGVEQEFFDSLDIKQDETGELAEYEDVTGYSEWTLPGGENYREITWNWKSAGDFKGQHGDIAGAKSFVHARVKDRVLDGKNVLYIEEIQSDRHKKGREKGYTTDDPGSKELKKELDGAVAEAKKIRKEFEALRVETSENIDAYIENSDSLPFHATNSITDDFMQPSSVDPIFTEKGKEVRKKVKALFVGLEKAEKIIEKHEGRDYTIPPAPFKKTEDYVRFAMKQLIQKAVAEGKDGVAWNKGIHQGVIYGKFENEGGIIQAGEGHHKQYDEIMPSQAKKILKNEYKIDLTEFKISPEMRTGIEKELNIDNVPTKGDAETVQGFEINDKLREALEEQPFELFQVARKKSDAKAKKDLTNPEYEKLVRKLKRKGYTFTFFGEREDAMDGVMVTSLIVNHGGKGRPNFFGERKGSKKVAEFRYIQTKEGSKEVLLPVTMKRDGIAIRVNKEHRRQGLATAMYYVAAKKEGMPVSSKTNKTEYGEAFRKAIRDNKIFKQGKTIRGSFDRMKNIITLGSRMNRSTFLHESGHYFLELMGDLAERPEASERLKKDYAKALEWMKVDSRDKIKRSHHEKFARGFEAYLRTGKAPNSELRNMFAKFRAWLVEIYSSLRDLNVNLSPEITGVFDRLLTTESDIENAKDGGSLQPLFSNMAQSGMNQKDAFDYTASVDRARRAAVEEMTARQMDDYDREQRNLKSAERNEVAKIVENQLQGDPVYVALANMQRGTLPNGDPLPEGMKRIKLGKAQTRAYFGNDDVFKALPRPFIYTLKGGVHPDVAAELFGFKDGHDLVDKIVKAQPYQEKLDMEVDKIMAEKEPTLKNNRQKEEEAAVKSVYNEKAQELMHKELKHMVSEDFAKFKGLAKKISRPVPTLKDVRETAQIMLQKRKVRDIRPINFKRATVKHGNMALDSFLKGDFEQAFEHKRLQLLNHALFRQSVEVRGKVAQYVRYARRFDTKPVRGRIGKAGADYMERIDAILEQYSFKRRSLKAVDRLKTLRQWVAEQESLGIDIAVPEKLLDESLKTNYQDAPLSEITEAIETIKTIEHLARTKNKLLAAGKQRSIEEAEAEIVSTIEAHHKMRDEPYDYAPGTKKRFIKGLKTFAAEHTKLEFLFEMLDGGKEGGAAWKNLFKPLADAENREADIMKDLTERMHRIFGVYTKRERALWYYHKIFIPEINTSLNKANILAVALNQGNEYNRAALMEGNQWNQGQVDAILKNMDKRDWETVQELWDLIDSLWPEVAKLEREMVGIVPPKVENKPIITPHGTFKGGYYPIIFDAERDFRQGQLEEAANVRDMFGGNFSRAMTKHGHTIARKGTDGKPLRLDLNGLSEHLSAVVHDFTHRRAIVDVGKLARREKIRAAIESALGREYYKQINPWLTAIAGDRQREPSTKFDALLSGARKNATVVNMGWKLTTAIVQFTGYSVSAKEMGVKYAMKGLKVFRSPRKSFQFIEERSAFMRGRMQNYDRDVRDSLKKLNVAGAKQSFLSPVDAYTSGMKDSYFSMIAYMDMGVAMPTWMGSYEKAMDGKVENIEGGDEAAAIDYADRTVRVSQGAGATKDLAFIQNRERLKIFTMFYSYFSVIFNQYQKAGFEFVNEKDVPKLVATLMWSWFLPAFLEELILGRAPEGEDKEEKVKRYLGKIAAYPFATIVGVRDIVSIFQGYGYSPSPAFDAVKFMGQTAHRLGKVATGEKDLEKKDVKSLFLTGGYLTGIPARQIWITGDAIQNYMVGDWQPENPGEAVWKGLVTGVPKD